MIAFVVQVEDQDGQAETIVGRSAVGMASLSFWSLEISHPHVVGERFTVGSGELKRVAIENDDFVIAVDRKVLRINIADDISGVMNGFKGEGEAEGHSLLIVRSQFTALMFLGDLPLRRVVEANRFCPLVRIQAGHGVADGNTFARDRLHGPDYSPSG